MTDVPEPDPFDLIAHRAWEQTQWATPPVNEPVDNPEPVVDPATRNLAMQLAMQKEPGADMPRLKALASEFESYLTQHD